MAECVMYTWDKMDTSIRIVADDIAEYIRDEGHTVEVITKIDGNACNKKYVFSTREHQSQDFVKMFRFIKPKCFIAIHTRNSEEFTDMEWGSFMLAFMQGHKGGSPIRIVAHSKYLADQINDRLSKLFSPSTRKAIAENTPFIPYGIRDEFRPKGTNDPLKWIVPFNRVTNTQKNVKLHAKVVGQYMSCLAQKGTPQPTHHYKYAKGFGPEDTKSDLDLSLYRMSPQPESRVQYMSDVSQYGMALSTSLYESFGIYYLELIASGCVVVFLDKPWIRKLLPNYAFIAKESELVPMLLAVSNDYEKAQAYLTEVAVPYIDKHYRLRKFVSQLLDTAEIPRSDTLKSY